MDQYIPPLPVVPPSPPSRKPYAIISIIFILALMAASVFFYTKYLQPAAKTLPAPVSYEEKLLVSCPTLQSFCQETGIYKEGSLSGTIKEKDPIYASFDGVMDAYTASQSLAKGYEPYRVVIVKNNQQGLRATYYFNEVNKNPVANKQVKEGDIIATGSGIPISFLQDQSLIYKLERMKDNNYRNFQLSKDIFK